MNSMLMFLSFLFFSGDRLVSVGCICSGCRLV